MAVPRQKINSAFYDPRNSTIPGKEARDDARRAFAAVRVPLLVRLSSKLDKVHQGTGTSTSTESFAQAIEHTASSGHLGTSETLQTVPTNIVSSAKPGSDEKSQTLLREVVSSVEILKEVEAVNKLQSDETSQSLLTKAERPAPSSQDAAVPGDQYHSKPNQVLPTGAASSGDVKDSKTRQTTSTDFVASIENPKRSKLQKTRRTKALSAAHQQPTKVHQTRSRNAALLAPAFQAAKVTQGTKSDSMTSEIANDAKLAFKGYVQYPESCIRSTWSTLSENPKFMHGDIRESNDAPATNTTSVAAAAATTAPTTTGEKELNDGTNGEQDNAAKGNTKTASKKVEKAGGAGKNVKNGEAGKKRRRSSVEQGMQKTHDQSNMVTRRQTRSRARSAKKEEKE